MRPLAVVFAGMLLMVGCDFSPTGPDRTADTVRSALGFVIIGTSDYLDAGGQVTQAHADLADQWWPELMMDLQGAGMDRAGASAMPGSVRIHLHQPRDADSLIYYKGTKDLVGAWYQQDPAIFHVPGDYTDPDGMLGRRPALQPIKHEALHHWCRRTLGRLCLAETDLDGNDKLDDHVWLSPDGTNIWLLTWQ